MKSCPHGGPYVDFEDEACRDLRCPGVGRRQMAYAPDVGRHWLKCCCCGTEWV